MISGHLWSHLQSIWTQTFRLKTFISLCLSNPHLFWPLHQCQNIVLQFCNPTSCWTFLSCTNLWTTPFILHRDAPMKHDWILMNPTSLTLVMLWLSVLMLNLGEQVLVLGLRSWSLKLDLPRCGVDQSLVRGFYSSPVSLWLRYPKGSWI